MMTGQGKKKNGETSVPRTGRGLVPDSPRWGRLRRFRRPVVAVGMVFILLLVVVAWVTVEDVRYNNAVQVLHSRIENAVDTGEGRVLERAAAGETIRAEDLADAMAFVKGESDGSDFRLVTLLRLRAGYGHRLEPAADSADRK